MTQRLKASTAEFFICFQTVSGIDDNTIINGGDGKITGLKTTAKPQGKGYYGFKMPKGRACEFELFDTKYTINCIPVWKCGARNCPGHERIYHQCTSGVWYCRRVKPACPGHSSKKHSCKDEGGQEWKCGEEKCPKHSKKKDTCKKPGKWFCGRFDPPCPGHADIDDACPDPHSHVLQFHIWKCGARDCPGHKRSSQRCSSGVWFCRRVKPACPGHSSKNHSCKDEGDQVWKCGEEKCPGHSKKKHTCKKPGRWFCGRSNPPCPGHDDINGTCSDIDTNEFKFTNWGGLAENDKTASVQRTLEVLGYYTGYVDHKKGEKTERAILNFQADNKLRTDGNVDIKTLQKLKDISNKNKLGKIRILRKNLIRFTRAPSSTDPNIKTGRPWGNAPDPDDRGFVKVSTVGNNLYGPVVSLTQKSTANSRVKIIRERISNSAKLEAVSSNESVFKVQSNKQLPSSKKCIIELKPVNKGNAELKIQYCKTGSSPFTIATLQVIVFQQITVKVRPYYVTLANASGANPQTPSLSKDDCNKIFDVVNNIWWHYGIYFKFLSWRDKKVTLLKAGTISKNPNLKAEFDKIINANDTSNNPSEKNVINIVIVKKIEGAYGVTYDALDYSWPNGIALQKNPSGNVSSGIDLAHEFGHFLGLANCFPPHSYIHAEDDPSVHHKKHDIWSLRKLMYGGWPKKDRPSDKWAHDVGYGDGQYGCLVSLRDNPLDKTDNACKNSRKWAANKTKLYHKP